MATVEQVTPEERFVLYGVPWHVYEALRAGDENYRVRMTYDEGALELMSPPPRHESVKRLVGQMLEAFTEELCIPRRSLSATTWKRPEMAKALEADECYYIRNQYRVCDRMEIDLDVDPPPDLALEVEIRPGVIQRIRIYAALGVSELWRWHDDELRAYLLGADGKYTEIEFSANLPMLRVRDLEPFLEWPSAADESAWIRSFRAWVRERFAGQLPSDQ